MLDCHARGHVLKPHQRQKNVSVTWHPCCELGISGRCERLSQVHRPTECWHSRRVWATLKKEGNNVVVWVKRHSYKLWLLVWLVECWTVLQEDVGSNSSRDRIFRIFGVKILNGKKCYGLRFTSWEPVLEGYFILLNAVYTITIYIYRSQGCVQNRSCFVALGYIVEIITIG